MEMSVEKAISVCFALLLSMSLIAVPVVAAGSSPYGTATDEDVQPIFRPNAQQFPPSVDAEVTERSARVDGGPIVEPIAARATIHDWAHNDTIDRDAILEDADLPPRYVELVDGDGVAVPEDGPQSKRAVSVGGSTEVLAETPTDEFAYNTSVEALLAAYETLDELDPDEGWADEYGNVTASLNATFAAYRSTNRVESVDAFENATDAQERLQMIAFELDAEADDPLENASDDLSEATQRTAELAVSDGIRLVETHDGALNGSDAFDEAQSSLLIATMALEGAEQMRNVSIPDGVSPENESVYRMGRNVLASYFEEAAWTHAQRAIDVVAAEVEPSLTVDNRRPIEAGDTMRVPIEARLSGVRPYAYDVEVVTEGKSESVDLALGGGGAPGSTAMGVVPVEVDRDTDAVNVTLTATRDGGNRTISTSSTIEIDPDEVVPALPDADEPKEIEIDDDESGATVTARGPGLRASDVTVTSVTPKRNTSAYASPILDVQNATAFHNATVVIPFAASRLDDENLSIVHFGAGPGDDGWRALETDVDATNATASANVTSFSRFAVMDPARIEGSTSEYLDPGWPVLDDFEALSGWNTAGSVTQQDDLAVLETDPRDEGDDPDPEPEEPVARISGPSVLEYAETGTWSAADSSGAGLSYQWGGDVDGSGQTVSDSFGMAPSTQQITLTVTDAEGRSDTTSQDVQIICPSGTCPEPYEVNETAGVESGSSAGSTDVHTSTMSRTFSIAEGVESAELKTSVLADVDPVGGATITVTGEDGDSRVLFERGEPGAPDGPVASISGPSEAEFAETYTWSGEESLGDGLSYEWSEDVDGTGPTVSKSFYEAPASKQITLTVTDDEGRSDETTQNVQVFCPSGSCPEPYEANATNTTLATHSGTWQDVSADISEYAGQEVTVTFEATDGAALSTEYVSVLTDAERSGVPDVAEELDLHMPASGEGRHLFSPLNLDPTVADTDGDGLRDGEEVTVAVDYRSTDSGGKLRASVRTARSHPARVDTTGDGLTDVEQVEGWRVNYASSREQTLDFLAALEAADDIGDLDDDLLETDTVDADPLVNDSDSDGLSDAQEVRYGTDPESTDTTGDGVSDGEALSGAYDPTLFDIKPPTIDVWYAEFDKPRWSYEGTYYTHYYVQDSAGLTESQVLHDGDVEETYPLYGTPGEPIESEVELGRLETIGDMFSGGTITVTAEDRNGNEVRTVAYEQTNVWGEIAEELRAQGLSHAAVEHHLGALSGMTAGAGEAYGFLLALYKNPRETIAAMTQIVDAIANLDEVISSLPDSIKEQQERNNPHEPGTDLHDAYRQGWYTGYVGWFVVEMAFPAGQIGKAAKNSDRFQNLADDLSTSEIRRAAELAGRAKHTAAAPVRYSKHQFARGLHASTTLGQEAAERVLRPIRSSGQQLQVAKRIDNADATDQPLATTPEGQELLGNVLARSDSPDATFFATARVCNSPCGPAIESLNRIRRNVDGMDRQTIENLGVTIERANRHGDIDIQDAEAFLGNLERLSRQDPSIEGLDSVIKRAGTSSRPPANEFLSSNFKGEVGAVTAATRAIDGGKTVRAMDKEIDTPRGKTDIDVELADGTAIEVKNFDYAERASGADPFVVQQEIDELAVKLEKYSDVSDSVVLATRGDPDAAEIPTEALKEADLSDGTSVEFKNIDELVE